MMIAGSFANSGAARLFLGLLLIISWSVRAQAAAERSPGEILFLTGAVLLDGVDLASGTLRLPVDRSFELKTGEDGQIRFVGPGREDTRLRERSHLVWNAGDQSWSVRSGLCGFWRRAQQPGSASDARRISVPQGECLMQSGILVVKVKASLSRVAAVKGAHQLLGPEGECLALDEKKERAVAWKQTSQAYEVTDDCYYAWYWK